MYTWRGISTCLPLSQGNEDPNRGEIHQKTVEILKPQIQGIYNMVEFVQESIKEFATGASGIKTLILMLKMDEGFVSQVRWLAYRTFLFTTLFLINKGQS